MRDAINANAIAVGITTAHTTTAGDVTLHVPKLKGLTLTTAIIERYRRRETSIIER